MRHLSKIIWFIGVAYSGAVVGAGPVGETKIEKIASMRWGNSMSETGIKVMLSGNFDNPDGCNKSEAVVLTNSTPNRKELVSLLTSAMMADKSVEFWVQDCLTNGHTGEYPVIWGVTVIK